MQLFDISADSKAILLLCGVFSGNNRNIIAEPLKIKEYNKLVSILTEKKLRPSDILDPEILASFRTEFKGELNYERITNLLNRGASLAFSIEKWTNKGVWIITRSDQIYPKKLRNKLGNYSPPILYGIGDIKLFDCDSLAVVGSRNVDVQAEDYTGEIGRYCAQKGIPIVSGGARGVDEIAMLSALKSYGTAIGVLADSLLRFSVSGKYRDAIVDQRLLLISTFNPEAGFNIGNAMGRNKYIYALSSYALIICAEKNKGGTWAGASEELKRENRIKVFVRNEGKVPEGNKELLKLGALPFPKYPWEESLFKTLGDIKISQSLVSGKTLSIFSSKKEEQVFNPKDVLKVNSDVKQVQNLKSNISQKNTTIIYEKVLPIFLDHMNDWITVDLLAKKLNIRKVQLQDWINKAVKAGCINKKTRPVRYKRHDSNSDLSDLDTN